MHDEELSSPHAQRISTGATPRSRSLSVPSSLRGGVLAPGSDCRVHCSHLANRPPPEHTTTDASKQTRIKDWALQSHAACWCAGLITGQIRTTRMHNIVSATVAFHAASDCVSPKTRTPAGLVRRRSFAGLLSYRLPDPAPSLPEVSCHRASPTVCCAHLQHRGSRGRPCQGHVVFKTSATATALTSALHEWLTRQRPA